MEQHFDIAVIGGGHAGIEAAHAGAVMGCRTVLITENLKAIGRMSCNPAIGGVAKGQLVRDIDALGGLMGVLADRCGIQFRMLNASKGPAVWGPRAQMDMESYARVALDVLQRLEHLTLLDGELVDLNYKTSGVFDLGLANGAQLTAKTIIISSGTFLDAIMYTGLDSITGGRVGEFAAKKLADKIKALGVRTIRLKTGTPSRIHKESIDFSRCIVQHGDAEPMPFSLRTKRSLNNAAVCWITNTNQQTHDVLKSGFGESPLFTGKIKGIGPRYCPSIEDKINRFSDKESHQLFLEPEGLASDRIYVNGFSSSLPKEVQIRALQTIPGLERCRVIQIGYAVEYDSIDATQLHPTLEYKDIPGLYFAGQVCGTSGYEEAGAQGLIAGINAALRVSDQAPFILSRSESYIGVMLDDIVSRQVDEPYRLFTSRAEYRLLLRQDNAEERLTEKGRRIRLVSNEHYRLFMESINKIQATRNFLDQTKITPDMVNRTLSGIEKGPIRQSERASALLRRPEFSLEKIFQILGATSNLSQRESQVVESTILYSGFLERQAREIERVKSLAHLRIPPEFNYDRAVSMRIEARQKLKVVRPLTVHLAAAVSGVTPADISGLLFHIKQGFGDS